MRQNKRLFWLVYGLYEAAAIGVLFYFLYTPVPPEGRNPFWTILGLPLLLPGLVLSDPIVTAFGFDPSPSKEVFAAVTILGCPGAPLLVAQLLRGWVSRRPRPGS